MLLKEGFWQQPLPRKKKSYDGGFIIGSWSPLIAINLLSHASSFSSTSSSLLFVPLALALNIIIGAAIIFAGSRVNPDTRNVDLD